MEQSCSATNAISDLAGRSVAAERGCGEHGRNGITSPTAQSHRARRCASARDEGEIAAVRPRKPPSKFPARPLSGAPHLGY